MSDFLFSSSSKESNELSSAINSIYCKDAPEIQEYYGDWGSLAVSQGHYHGFLPYENEQHILVVIGGPVLYFSDNDFLVETDSSIGSERIYHRWVIQHQMQWDEDLSGPFTVFLLDKLNKELQVVTDLMAFIPIYTCIKSSDYYIGTHVDALARICGESKNHDPVSIADFILNDAVTYPYTVYKKIRQEPPSSIIRYKDARKEIDSYWLPNEKNTYRSLKEASLALRSGISGYVRRVTEKMQHVAQFISAGEDSRSLSGLLPHHLKRDAFIFLDHMNREGRIAKRVAETYGTNFTIGKRKNTHYIDILPEASCLIGAGHQYTHAHSLGFNRYYKLDEYTAVFGGYLSDSLLKGVYSRVVRGLNRFPFLPKISMRGENRSFPIINRNIEKCLLDELSQRRKHNL